MTEHTIHVLCGGESEEREVSLKSGNAVFNTLKGSHRSLLHELPNNDFPEGLNPETSIVFPLIHGAFGEDGALQEILEGRAFIYVGSDACVSQLCINKSETKCIVSEAGIPVLNEKRINVGDDWSPRDVLVSCGDDWIMKPLDGGSSVGIVKGSGIGELNELKASGNTSRPCLFEPFIAGIEVTVGLLEGRALGLVEVEPIDGFFDYNNKYTKGKTRYHSPPLHLDAALQQKLKVYAEAAYDACACRDFARADFIIENNTIYFLEMNTIPGMTETSLLPKCAAQSKLDFHRLCQAMLKPALKRWKNRKKHDLSAI